MSENFHSVFLKNFSLMLNDADDYNVIIQVGKDQKTKEFHAHSNILSARSPYFKIEFLKRNFKIEGNNMIKFSLPNITPTVFELTLRYIYTGELNLTKKLGGDILELLFAAEKLLLRELFKHVQDYLIEQTTWVQQNLYIVLCTVFELANYMNLQDYCIESICANPQQFMTSRRFPSIDNDILNTLLKREDLHIDEIIVWDCLIKWGIKQTPDLGSDRTKWSIKNYKALKKTLSQFIPLIRFVEISPDDFFDKVRPYEAIIPKHIYDKVEEFYYKDSLPKTTVLPPRTGKIASRIIKQKLSSIIINWINRKNANSILDRADLSYRFNLIYRRSHDGNNIRDKCNGKRATLILIKVKNSEKIFGGYNPIGWRYDNHGRLSTTESFIFSFENNEDNENMKICRVINSSYAIVNDDYDDYRVDNSIKFGHDLLLNYGYLYISYSGNYENNFGMSFEGNVEEVEAFSVKKLKKQK